MKEFFYPDSVVVVGVSPAADNYGRVTIKNFHNFGYRGHIFAVGREHGSVDGVAMFPSIADLPESPDLAIVLTPAQRVPGVIRDCGEKGIKHAAILSAGFVELGAERSPLQQELVESANRYGVRFIGPNCFGIICPESGLVVPFALLRPQAMRPGSFSFLSQSGTYCLTTGYGVTMAGVGLAKSVSMGNKLNVDEVDLLPYLIDEDERTKTIGLYLEGLNRGREFIALARRSAKPVVVLKANISEEIGPAARSHTASLASDDRVVEGAFRQAGIVRIKEVRHFATAAKALNLPLLRGSNLGIAVGGGGAAVTASDWCFSHGFKLPQLPDGLRAALKSQARASIINYGNPLDLADSADVDAVLFAAEQLLSLPEIDGLVFTPLHITARPTADADAEATIERVRELMRRLQKPIALSIEAEPAIRQQLRDRTGFPLFDDTDEALAGLGMLREYSRYRAKAQQVPVPLPVDKAGAGKLIAEAHADGLRDIGPAAMAVLAAYGLATAPLHFAANPDEAVAKAGELGYPIVLKVVARDLSHKSDVGGVALNLANADAVHRAFREMQDSLRIQLPQAELGGVVVQRMISGGHELILGAKHDPHFGPVVMFGLGGIFTEVFADVGFRLAPLTREEAEELIWEVKASKILKGMRGQPPADVPALADAVVRLGQLIGDWEEIKEIDVNPIKVFAAGEGAVAVDARIVLG